MPEGNETHRWAELHAGMFAGKKVHVDSAARAVRGGWELVDGKGAGRGDGGGQTSGV